MPEHFVTPPHWTWYILGYFFLAGVSGGAYALATMLRLWGGPEDERAARVGYLVAFPVLVACPILLTLDLGQPGRFWHMLVNVTPGAGGLILKGVSPMSVGAWALTLFGVFALVSFLHALGPADGRPPGRGHLAFNIVGALLGLYVASYTGVLLSVSNQPVWSDSWTLGGLFLASGLTGAAALLGALARHRQAVAAEHVLRRADAFFALLELIWIVLLLLSLAAAGALARLFGAPAWIVLWLLVALGLLPSLLGLRGRGAAVSATATAVVVLVGVLALRAVILFSAQV
jgi:formate-dependent nitrite reductase membrane component NrfD